MSPTEVISSSPSPMVTMSPAPIAWPSSRCEGRWTTLTSASASGRGSPKRMSTPAAAISAASGPTSTIVLR